MKKEVLMKLLKSDNVSDVKIGIEIMSRMSDSEIIQTFGLPINVRKRSNKFINSFPEILLRLSDKLFKTYIPAELTDTSSRFWIGWLIRSLIWNTTFKYEQGNNTEIT